MQIKHDVFNEAELEVILHDLHRDRVWTSASKNWNAGLLHGVEGSCDYSIPNMKVEGIVRQKVVGWYPEWRRNQMKIIFHRWNVRSALALHDDGSHAFAATIYLNKEWHLNAGGLFVWEDKQDELKVFKPEFNAMVVNVEFEKHMVTPITTAAVEPRYSIQVFGVTN